MSEYYQREYAALMAWAYPPRQLSPHEAWIVSKQFPQRWFDGH